jgi:regulator of CtrA degradation
MNQATNINPRIVEGLYCEALVLSDEVRAAFDLSGRIEQTGGDEDSARIALSCEALRTTTRMMHAVAWLLNHRAYFLGELSEFQLRRYGRLSPDFPVSDADRMALLSPQIRELIRTTEAFYSRLLRIDRSWRDASSGAVKALDQLRARLGQQVA